MPKVAIHPADVVIELEGGLSILDAILLSGVDFYAPCGGQGICGKCLVSVESGDMKGEINRDGMWYACRTYPLTDCVITLPDISVVSSLNNLNRGIAGKIRINPPVFREIQIDLPHDELSGVAIDFGTTSVTGALANLKSGEVSASVSTGNPQGRYGDDVISRIAYASNPSGLDMLHRAAIDCVNDVINRLCSDAKVEEKRIIEIVCSGNSTMAHLIAGISPARLGLAPYEPEFRSLDPIPFRVLGINGNDDGHLRLLPNIAGFVGGDTVAGIIATGINHSDSLNLFIDIGTNGEIAVGNRDRILVTSAAAGPAFEGGRIENGMRAEPGAIDHVRINDDINFTTIGHIEPRGICGSGLVEATASMLSRGLIGVDGKLITDTQTGNLPPALKNRFDGSGGKRRFYVHKDKVWISQKDISELQLAKAAIRSSIDLLLDEWGASVDEVDKLWIAGAFGFYLKVDDLITIGLIPSVQHSKVIFAGNTSLEGAYMAMESYDSTLDVDEVSGKAEFIELAGKDEFRDRFVEMIAFP